MNAKRLFTSLVFLMAFLLAALAVGDSVSTRRVGVHEKKGEIVVSFGFRDVFTEKIKQQMGSGLPTRVVVQIALENYKGQPVELFARKVQITYDLWDENYAIQVLDPARKRHARVKTLEEAISAAGAMWQAGIAPSRYTGVHRLMVIVEVNPVSEQMVRNIQGWIMRPAGGLDSATGQSYFGSFVGYFVDRKIGKADHSIRFVSQWFTL